MNKKELLKQHIGELAFSFHSGDGEIINSRTIIEITEDSINKISKRKQAYIRPNTWNFIKLWDETEKENHETNR